MVALLLACCEHLHMQNLTILSVDCDQQGYVCISLLTGIFVHLCVFLCISEK